VISKIVPSTYEAVKGIKDGDTILLGGFTDAGAPQELLLAVLDMGIRDLMFVHNGAGYGDTSLAKLVKAKRVRKIICSFPGGPQNQVLREALERKELELEVCPQGTMVERVRAAGAGLGGVLTKVGLGTELAAGKPVYELDGQQFVVERPISGEWAMIRAYKADPYGNLQYRYSQQNFNNMFATGARSTVVQADFLVGLGEMDPQFVHTPGIFVHRVVQIDRGVYKS
jgi:3-oxoadipate CoA-transferase alpha subunit